MPPSFLPPRRVTIGAAAAFVGTTPRAIRHYHGIGLLPEPERGADGLSGATGTRTWSGCCGSAGWPTPGSPWTTSATPSPRVGPRQTQPPPVRRRVRVQRTTRATARETAWRVSWNGSTERSPRRRRRCGGDGPQSGGCAPRAAGRACSPASSPNASRACPRARCARRIWTACWSPSGSSARSARRSKRPASSPWPRIRPSGRSPTAWTGPKRRLTTAWRSMIRAWPGWPPSGTRSRPRCTPPSRSPA